MPSREELERMALDEYERFRGKVVRVKAVNAFADREAPYSTDVHLDPPAVARVLPTLHEDILRWMDHEFLDPVYDVRILEDRPELEGMWNFYIYGTSRGLDGSVSPGDIVDVVHLPAALRYRFRRGRAPT